MCVCVCVPLREGIQWEAIDWMDNAECLDLIEKVTQSEQSHRRGLPLTAGPRRTDLDATPRFTPPPPSPTPPFKTVSLCTPRAQ